MTLPHVDGDGEDCACGHVAAAHDGDASIADGDAFGEDEPVCGGGQYYGGFLRGSCGERVGRGIQLGICADCRRPWPQRTDAGTCDCRGTMRQGGDGFGFHSEILPADRIKCPSGLETARGERDRLSDG